MRKYSKSRQKTQRRYEALLREKAEEAQERGYCKGCGRAGVRQMPSHRIPRSRRADLIADSENVEYLCEECSANVELGNWHLLRHCKEIEEYIQREDEEYYLSKKLK